MGGNVVTIESEIENKQIDTLLQVQNSSLSTQKLWPTNESNLVQFEKLEF